MLRLILIVLMLLPTAVFGQATNTPTATRTITPTRTAMSCSGTFTDTFDVPFDYASGNTNKFWTLAENNLSRASVWSANVAESGKLHIETTSVQGGVCYGGATTVEACNAYPYQALLVPGCDYVVTVELDTTGRIEPPWSSYGIMIRATDIVDGTNKNSYAFLGLGWLFGGEVYLHEGLILSGGYRTRSTAGFDVYFSKYLQIRKSGTQYTFFHSSDGVNFVQLSADNPALVGGTTRVRDDLSIDPGQMVGIYHFVGTDGGAFDQASFESFELVLTTDTPTGTDTPTPTVTNTPTNSRTVTYTGQPTNTVTSTWTQGSATPTRTATPTPRFGCRYDVLLQTDADQGMVVASSKPGEDPAAITMPITSGYSWQYGPVAQVQSNPLFGAASLLLRQDGDSLAASGCLQDGQACAADADCCPNVSAASVPEEPTGLCVGAVCASDRSYPRQVSSYEVQQVETIERWPSTVDDRQVVAARLRLLMYITQVEDLGGFFDGIAGDWVDFREDCDLGCAGDGATTALSSAGNCGAMCSEANLLVMPQEVLTADAWHEFPLDLPATFPKGMVGVRIFPQSAQPPLDPIELATILWGQYEAGVVLTGDGQDYAPQLVLETCPLPTPTAVPCDPNLGLDTGGFNLNVVSISNPTPKSVADPVPAGHILRMKDAVVSTDGATDAFVSVGPGAETQVEFTAAGSHALAPMCGVGPLTIRQTGTANVTLAVDWKKELNQ